MLSKQSHVPSGPSALAQATLSVQGRPPHPHHDFEFSGPSALKTATQERTVLTDLEGYKTLLFRKKKIFFKDFMNQLRLFLIHAN